MTTPMNKLLGQIRNCKECEKHFELGANPIIAASSKNKLIIIGQAPGRIVHNTSIPWNDKSGDNLRNWLGIDRPTFYNADLITLMPNATLVLLIGQYAQNYYLGDKAKNTLTETVHHFKTYLPKYLPLPHPSPRNNIWQAKNEWFGREVLPELKRKIQNILS